MHKLCYIFLPVLLNYRLPILELLKVRNTYIVCGEITLLEANSKQKKLAFVLPPSTLDLNIGIPPRDGLVIGSACSLSTEILIHF